MATTADGGFVAVCTVTVTIPSGIKDTEVNVANIKVVDGGIAIEGVSNETEIEVLAVDGKIIYKGKDRRITLPTGFYIVNVGQSHTKVFVK